MTSSEARIITLLEVASRLVQEADAACELADLPKWKVRIHGAALILNRLHLDSFDDRVRGTNKKRKRR